MRWGVTWGALAGERRAGPREAAVRTEASQFMRSCGGVSGRKKIIEMLGFRSI